MKPPKKKEVNNTINKVDDLMTQELVEFILTTKPKATAPLMLPEMQMIESQQRSKGNSEDGLDLQTQRRRQKAKVDMTATSLARNKAIRA